MAPEAKCYSVPSYIHQHDNLNSCQLVVIRGQRYERGRWTRCLVGRQWLAKTQNTQENSATVCSLTVPVPSLEKGGGDANGLCYRSVVKPQLTRIE